MNLDLKCPCGKFRYSEFHIGKSKNCSAEVKNFRLLFVYFDPLFTMLLPVAFPNMIEIKDGVIYSLFLLYIEINLLNLNF